MICCACAGAKVANATSAAAAPVKWRNCMNPPLIRFVSHHTTKQVGAVKPMRIRPLAQDAKLSRRLFEQLASEIKSGRLAPGERLPTEQALTRAAKVS